MSQQQTVTIFKNGYGFFIKQQHVTAPEKTFQITDLPGKACLGTLWFFAPHNQIKNIYSKTEQLKIEQPVNSISELLKANKGANAKFILNTIFTANTSCEGIIENILDRSVILKSGTEWLVINIDQIQQITISQQLNTIAKEDSTIKVLQFELNTSSKDQLLESRYLQKGIIWIPNYSIDLINETQAQISMSATIINDIEDLHKAQVRLVIGTPNFSDVHFLSPLVSGLTCWDYINNNSMVTNDYNNNAYNQVLGYEKLHGFKANNQTREEDLNDLTGEKIEDYFFYDLPVIDLKKSESSDCPVFQSTVDYEHVYEVMLTPFIVKDGYYQENGEVNDLQVWHSLKIKNNTKFPWTTGSALVTQNNDGKISPLNKDTIKYTVPGNWAKIRMTKSPDISVATQEIKLSEEEKKRKRNTFYYELVTMEGKIQLSNHKDKKIKLNITREISGEMVKSSIKFDAHKLTNTVRDINMSHNVEWEIELNANEKTEITYTYSVYIKS